MHVVQHRQCWQERERRGAGLATFDDGRPAFAHDTWAYEKGVELRFIEPGNRVVSKNRNELKTRAPGRFGLDVSRLG